MIEKLQIVRSSNANKLRGLGTRYGVLEAEKGRVSTQLIDNGSWFLAQ